MLPFVDPRVEIVRSHLSAAAEVLRRAVTDCAPAIIAASDLVTKAFESGGKLLLCGNGGSAADCQHLATEFTCRLSADFVRPALPALALTTDTSFLTAYANDFDFEGIFARQVRALGKAGDVLLAISTGGSSENVVRAVETARSLNIKTIALTGMRGKLRDLADIAVCVPSESTTHIQETHLAIEHIVCHLVEQALYGQCVEGLAPKALHAA